MDYKSALSIISDDTFEALTISLCEIYLGASVTGFAKGRDGGKDGRFDGKARNYPNEVQPWEGLFVIQAKHTSSTEASFSDTEFSGKSDNSAITKEIEKIKNLKLRQEVDYYMFFANRKLTGGLEEQIRKRIVDETGIKNVAIIGIEKLSSWLSQNPNIIKKFELDKYIVAFDFYDKDIRDMIIVFNQKTPLINLLTTIEDTDLEYIEKDVKNRLNELTQEYFDNQIKNTSLKFFKQIDDFLEDPINTDYMLMYLNFSDELNRKIDVVRSRFREFEQIFVYMYDTIFDRHEEELKKFRPLIWIFLHHMYYNCHIGKKHDNSA